MSTPSNKKPKLTSDSSLDFDAMEAHLRQWQTNGTLVDILKAVWGQNDETISKAAIIAQATKGNEWAAVVHQEDMFQHDWKIDDDNNDRDPQLLQFASNKIRLGTTNGPEDFDVKDLSGCSLSIKDGGCDCISGDEVYDFTMQKSMTGAIRLEVHFYRECRCCESDNDAIEENDYIAWPILKESCTT